LTKSNCTSREEPYDCPIRTEITFAGQILMLIPNNKLHRNLLRRLGSETHGRADWETYEHAM